VRVVDLPSSPRAHRLATPSWLDARLVLGVLLVLVSVVVGARVLSSADQSTLVWAAARDVAPGTVLTAADLEPQRVRLFEPSQRTRYVSAQNGRPPVDYVARVSLAAGDLVPSSALLDLGADTDFRQVTLQVQSGHAPPDLRGGQQVDVYVTPAGDAGVLQGVAERAGAADAPAPGAGAPAGREASAPVARLLLAGLTVQSVPSGGGFAADDARAVVLNVSPEQVRALVGAASQGQVDLVRVRGQDEVQPQTRQEATAPAAPRAVGR
jgi:hypothetical protein